MHAGALDFAVLGAYYVVILGFGAWFGRNTRTTRDFFLAGQRFPWWLIAFSLIASIVGSHSFIKYTAKAYEYGLSTSQTYLNDWYLLPLLLLGWLPIVYFLRITSVPEYFGRRFDRRTGVAVTVFILLYIVGYLGINLLSLGKALSQLTGMPVFPAAALATVTVAIYVTAGGQASVIMTDLLQGVLLLLIGLGLFGYGVYVLGGPAGFWDGLGEAQRRGLPAFNQPADFNFIGVFWQDAVANGIAAYFLNQGILMRFLSARSPDQARKAIGFTLLALMPLGAVAVSGTGWIGAALDATGVHIPGLDGADGDAIFVAVAGFLCSPGMFGLVIAALTAALMSTADTFINAVSAIAVNDIYVPFFRHDAPDRDKLRLARWVSIAAAALGLALVPAFQAYGSIYNAHAAMVTVTTPPMAVVLLFGLCWRRYTSAAAFWTLVGGLVAIAASYVFPDLVAPFRHGVPAGLEGDGYMRALYGISVCSVLSLVITPFTRPRPAAEIDGLVVDSVAVAERAYKGGGVPNHGRGRRTRWAVQAVPDRPLDPALGDVVEGTIHLPAELAERIGARPGDIVFVAHPGWWSSSFRAARAVVGTEPGGVQAGVTESVLRAGRLEGLERLSFERII